MIDKYFDQPQRPQAGESPKREVIKASWRPVIEFSLQREKSHPDMLPPVDIQDRIVHIRQGAVAGKALSFLIFFVIAFFSSIYVGYTQVVDFYFVYGLALMLGLMSGTIGLFGFFHEKKLKDSTEERGVKRLISEIYFDTLKSVKTVYWLYWVILAVPITATALKYSAMMQLFGRFIHEIEKMIYLFTKTQVILPADDILFSWLITSLLFTLGDYFYVRFSTREVRRADSA